jgi:PAS domain S-box-containing protein
MEANRNQQTRSITGKEMKAPFSLDATHLRTITDSVPQLIWENNPQGEAIYFNKRWFEFSGLSYEDSLGAGWVVMAHPDDDNAVYKWRKALESGQLFESEVRLRKHDGQYIWHLLRNTPLQGEDDEIVGWFGTATDIHEQKRTASLFSETSEKLRAIFEAAIDFAIITLDRNGYIIDWNSGAEKMFGYSRDEAIGQYVNLIFTPEDIKAGIPQIEMDKANKTGKAMDERWHLRKDQTRFFMSGVLKSIYHSSINGYVKVAREITDRKLAEEALFLSEQHKSLAVQSAQMGEWNYNLSDDVIDGDEQSNILFGLKSPGSKLSLDEICKVIHSEDRAVVQQSLQTALNGLNIFHSEFRVRDPDVKTTKWVSVYGRVVAHFDEKPSKLIGVIYDITTRKLHEKQKDDFISIASHELKSPVTSIKAYSEILQDAFEEIGDTEHAILVKKLNTQVDKLVKLIYNLLDASNLSELSLKLKPQPVDINQLIVEHLSGFELNGAVPRIKFKPASVPITYADPERISQVLGNLITNALKYSASDKEVLIFTEDMLEAVKVTVQDFGMGIPADAQPYIFDRYFRVYDENLTYSQGLGLGLYISAEIIRQHFGTIGVESTPGKGSTFYFTLPYS